MLEMARPSRISLDGATQRQNFPANERNAAMKSSHWSIVLLLVGLAVGFAAGGAERQSVAQAQAPGGTVSLPKQVGRFQISAWGHGNQVGPGSRGCYIVDTASGELWHVATDGSGGIAKKIVQQLQ
ncbi:MAG: hypothetical protein HY290_03620 [Planctomycetia bacterium]|nr:hypothetical protein [Planctomycetia bacterium]